MNQESIIAITMPKWGLSMLEGTVVEWLVNEGVELKLGDEVMDIETEKIANTFEALDAGVLRRKVADAGDVLPIGALLGVLAAPDVSDDAIDAFVEEFQANYVPPEPDDEDLGPSYEFAEVNGHRIRYVRAGESGPDVVLIHGFGGDLDGWMFVQTALAANARVLALDLPGHGQSGKQISDGGVGALAGAVTGLLAALDITDAHVVGHSLGGAVAIAVAASAPERAASLTLLAPAGLTKTINGAYLDGFVEAESRREIKPHLKQLVADDSLINRSFIDDILKFKRLDGVVDALRLVGAAVHDGDTQRVDLTTELVAFAGPKQVLWGSADQIIAAPAESDMPVGVSFAVLDGCGHLPHLEAASAVNQAISALLNR